MSEEDLARLIRNAATDEEVAAQLEEQTGGRSPEGDAALRRFAERHWYYDALDERYKRTYRAAARAVLAHPLLGPLRKPGGLDALRRLVGAAQQRAGGD